jgi:hypothetical protein
MTLIHVHQQTKGHGAVSVARVAEILCERHEGNASRSGGARTQ